MYLDRNGQLFTAGHDSVGLPAPATHWLLAEGATGPFFDLFILLANPSAQDAEVRLRFLLGDGTVIEHPTVVPALARATVWVDALGQDASLIARNPSYARLADSSVSTEIVVDNGVATTTGITASMPMSLTLIEAIAGRDKARAVGRDIGLPDWDARHESDADDGARSLFRCLRGRR